MCWMVAIPIALAAAQSLNSSNQQNKAIAAQANASRSQSLADLKAMNIQNADDNLKARAALDDASNELTGRNMQQVQAMGTLRAAIGESGLEGNSMRRIEMISEGNHIREANSVTDGYKRDYASIFAGQVGRTETTKDAIEARQAGEQKKVSPLMQGIQAGMAAGSAWAGSSMSGGGAASSGGSAAPISQAVGTPTGR